MPSKFPFCLELCGISSIRRPLIGMVALFLLPMWVSNVEAKPGSFHTVPIRLTPANTHAQTRITVAASQAHGEVSDAPPAYINGVFINYPKQDKTVPGWLKVWNSTVKARASAPSLSAACVMNRGNLHASLVRMAALYATIESE